MANPFEEVIQSLLDSGEKLSSVIYEFSSAVGSHDREIGQLISEVADVLSESEYTTGGDGDDEEEEEDDLSS